MICGKDALDSAGAPIRSFPVSFSLAVFLLLGSITPEGFGL
jgi:hypothetical protein